MGRIKAAVGAGLAALLIASAVLATTAAPASAAPTVTTYIQAGAVLLEYQPLTIGDVELGTGVPLPVLKVQARVSTLPKPSVFGSGGIPGLTLVFSVGGVTVCTVPADSHGVASCALSLQNQLDAILGKSVVWASSGTRSIARAARPFRSSGRRCPPSRRRSPSEHAHLALSAT
jgi:hypothetical protein